MATNLTKPNRYPTVTDTKTTLVVSSKLKPKITLGSNDKMMTAEGFVTDPIQSSPLHL